MIRSAPIRHQYKGTKTVRFEDIFTVIGGKNYKVIATETATKVDDVLITLKNEATGEIRDVWGTKIREWMDTTTD